MLNSTPRRTLFIGLLALALQSTVQAQPAAAWKPDRPVTLVVPYSAGGGVDAQARAVARELSAHWGQPVLVDNVEGAEGLIGTRKVTAAKPDGLTLLVQIPSIALLKHLPSSKGYDPLAQLAPVAELSVLPGIFAVNAALPAKTLAEAVQHCRKAVPPCSIGTTENVARLQARMLQADAGLAGMVVVNYKGGGQIVTDLLANNVNMGIMGPAAVLPHHRSGALRILAVLGNKRSAALPAVPTVAEAGFPALQAITWYGLFAPRDTPKPVVDGIAAAVARAVKSGAALTTFATFGADASGAGPGEFAATVQGEVRRLDAAVQRFPLD
jgi:tripartite-type tricarboxylate transporter receptor subunit TctC